MFIFPGLISFILRLNEREIVYSTKRYSGIKMNGEKIGEKQTLGFTRKYLGTQKNWTFIKFFILNNQTKIFFEGRHSKNILRIKEAFSCSFIVFYAFY